MKTTRDRIHGLAQRGAVSPDDAEALLAAVGDRRWPRWASVLLDPLEFLGAVQLTLIGLIIALFGIGLERFGVVFDGFFDVHATRAPWTLQHSVVRALAAWPLGALVLWSASLVAGRHGRLIDFVGFVGFSRLPVVVFATPLAVVGARHGISGEAPIQGAAPTPLVIAVVVLAVAGLVWSVVLSYRSFVTASGLRGGTRVVAYVAGALFAEIASKLVLASI